LLQSVILGIVQGLGEFLPISSSAHLVLVPWFFGWVYHGLTFDVALHLGTLFAVVVYFWRDWLQLLNDGLRGYKTQEGRLFWYLVIATIPGAVFGYFLEEQAETIFREPLVIAIMLIIMGIILYVVDTYKPKKREMGQIRLSDSIWIGLSQAMAIIPGVSRSGVTITTARYLGLSRETAARFSFLLSTPIIFGAALLQSRNLTLEVINTSFITGILISAIVGFFAIKLLLRYVTNKSYAIFSVYRFILGFAVIFWVFFKH